VKYWLVKSEPSVFSIDDLKKIKVTAWDGVRNYQARNFLKAMKRGDLLLIYHSNEQPVGVAGMAEIVKEAYPDPSQFDKKSEYYDAAATKENPRWVCPDVKFVEKFKRIVTLQELRSDPKLSGLMLLKKGSRLSVIPVAPDEFRRIVKLANG
jgi:predicted RNA-binding protein with PUA-like domain